MRFAVIKTNGYQYLVSKGESIIVPANIGKIGKEIVFDKVLMVKDKGKAVFGQPYVTGSKVKGIVREQGRMPKVVVFKFRRRKKYRRKAGHRQDFSKIEITDIVKVK
jgi:large subunit ribosomal protein L21